MKLPPLTLACALLALTGVARAENGKTLYEDNCRKCHGSDGQAQTVRGYLYFAQDFTSPKWQAKRSDDDILRLISDGPGWWSSMPAFKKRLSEDERRALVPVVRGFAKPAAP